MSRSLLVAVAVAALLTRTAEAQSFDPDTLHPGILIADAPTHPVHFTLDATATYGIGTYSALGAQLHFVAFTPVWTTSRATGSIDLGVLVGAQDEPQFLQYTSEPYFKSDLERLNTWVTLGHTIHFGPNRRAGLGLHLFAGWTQDWASFSIHYPAAGLAGSLKDSYGIGNVGGMLKFDYRFSDWVGLSVQAVGPFPVGPSFITTLFHVGLGLCFYLD